MIDEESSCNTAYSKSLDPLTPSSKTISSPASVLEESVPDSSIKSPSFEDEPSVAFINSLRSVAEGSADIYCPVAASNLRINPSARPSILTSSASVILAIPPPPPFENPIL